MHIFLSQGPHLASKHVQKMSEQVFQQYMNEDLNPLQCSEGPLREDREQVTGKCLRDQMTFDDDVMLSRHKEIECWTLNLCIQKCWPQFFKGLSTKHSIVAKSFPSLHTTGYKAKELEAKQQNNLLG